MQIYSNGDSDDLTPLVDVDNLAIAFAYELYKVLSIT